MTMVIFFHTSVESCGRGHGISSREEEVCPSSPKTEEVMTMVIFFHSSVDSCGGGHVIYILQKRRSALQVLRRRGV